MYLFVTHTRKVWKQKVSTHKGSLYHKKREWRLLRNVELDEQAAKLMSYSTKLIVWSGKTNAAEEVISEITSFQRGIQMKTSVDKEQLVVVPYLNWVSMGSIGVAVKEGQAQIINWTLQQNDKNLGLVQMPTFSYKKGGLWEMQKSAVELLRKGAVNVDIEFCIPMKDQVDQRDTRPMIMPGRIVTCSHVDAMDKDSPWRQTPLIKNRRTEDVSQVPSREMRNIEDLDPNAPPETTDIDAAIVQGASKFEQLGTPAMEALLDAILVNYTDTGRRAHLILDLRVKSAHLLTAVHNKKTSYSTPLFYCGVCEDMTEFQWVTHMVTKHLAKGIGDGTIVVPGFNPKSTEMPAELAEAPPPPPTLNVLPLGGRSREQLQVPLTAIKKYSTHDEFGPLFNKFMDGLFEEFGQAEPEEPQVDPDKTPRKRTGGDNPSPSPTKKTRIAPPEKIIEASEVKGQKVYDTPIVSVKDTAGQLRLHIRAGNKPYLINMTGHEVKINQFQLLCHYGKGGFKMLLKVVVFFLAPPPRGRHPEAGPSSAPGKR